MRIGMAMVVMVAALACAPNQPVQAAQQRTIRIYGPIQRVDGKTISVHNNDGKTVTFTATGRIVSNQPIKLSAVKAGMSVAFDTTIRDGRLVVTQFHTQPWRRPPGTFATRPLRSDAKTIRHLGWITAVKPVAGGIEMTAMHEGNKGAITVMVPNDVPYRYNNKVETAAALKPGALVMANATRGKDGKWGSGFVTVEADGNKPVRIPE